MAGRIGGLGRPPPVSLAETWTVAEDVVTVDVDIVIAPLEEGGVLS